VGSVFNGVDVRVWRLMVFKSSGISASKFGRVPKRVDSWLAERSTGSWRDVWSDSLGMGSIVMVPGPEAVKENKF